MRRCGWCDYPVYDPKDKSEVFQAAMMSKDAVDVPDPIAGWDDSGEALCEGCVERYDAEPVTRAEED